MLRWLRPWREQGWTVIEAKDYRLAWQAFGGSLMTHPDVVERLADLAGIPVRYLGWYQNEQLVAAMPCWGRYLALSKEMLKHSGKKRLFDLGNAEVILPIAADACVPIRHSLHYVSERNQGQIKGLKEQSEQLALARPHEDYSGRYRYNLRRDLRLIKEAGGYLSPITELAPEDRARIYADLFQKRWNFEVPAKAHLAEVFSLLNEFMTGSVVYLGDGQPLAIQVLYRAESPRWVSVEYINGGVDPEHQVLAAGSVLTFVNTQDAWADATAKGKELRYSFGRADREYKDMWCHRKPVYQV